MHKHLNASVCENDKPKEPMHFEWGPAEQVIFNKARDLQREVLVVNSADISMATIEPLTSNKVCCIHRRSGMGGAMGAVQRQSQRPPVFLSCTISALLPQHMRA